MQGLKDEYNTVNPKIINLIQYLMITSLELLLFAFYFVSEAQKFKNYLFLKEKKLNFLLKFSDFNGFDHISSHNGWFTHQI